MVSDRVATILRSLKHYDSLEVADNTALIDELGFTSLDIMNLILALEKQFQISFTDDDLDLERFATFGAVIRTLQAYDVSAA